MSEIAVPQDRNALITLGRNVADHEEELPEADRLRKPAAAEIRAQADECDRANRASDRYRRTSEMETKKAGAAQVTLETLLRRFAQQRKQVVADLTDVQEWGFEVVEHAAPAGEVTTEPEEGAGK